MAGSGAGRKRVDASVPAKKTALPITARDYALRLLTIRPRSVREMRDRLARNGYGKSEIEETVADLVDLRLLDDRKFAMQWVESRMALKPMGISRLRAELAAKGVERDVIETILSKYRNDIDERSTALILAQRKMKVLKKLDPEVARRRLASFLSRRGFSAQYISEALKKTKLDRYEIG